ncbi:MAG TPA: PilZ domain-containing protein [Terriglobales bacterium]
MDAGEWTDSEPERRRKFPRYKTTIAVELWPDGATVASRNQTSEISVGGCYIEMNFTYQAGAHLKIILWVGDEKIATEAQVITHDFGFGNGICFLNMSDADKAKLKKHLDTLEPTSAPAP